MHTCDPVCCHGTERSRFPRIDTDRKTPSSQQDCFLSGLTGIPPFGDRSLPLVASPTSASMPRQRHYTFSTIPKEPWSPARRRDCGEVTELALRPVDGLFSGKLSRDET